MKRQLWWGGWDWGRASRPPLVELEYRYDRASNITNRDDARPGMTPSETNTLSQSFAHDNLDRLTAAAHSTTAAPPAPLRLDEAWTLDALGNWGGFSRAAAAGTFQTEQRSFNATNEITGATVGADPPREYAFDPDGNLKAQELTPPGTPAGDRVRRLFTYDAWNRLTRVSEQTRTAGSVTWDGPTFIRCAYTWYAGGQLATRVADTDREGLGRPDRRTHYYYDSAWRLLEERIDPGYDATWSPPPPEGTGQSGTPPPWDWNDLTNTFATAFDPGRNRRTGRQYIWDPTASGGGDELLQFRTAPTPTVGGGGSGTAGGELLFDKSWWSLTDRMGSVLGLVADSASGGGADWTPSERVEYSPYGRPRTMPRADASGNGTVDFADISAIYASYGKTLTQPGYKARADLSADGAVGYSDISAVWASWGQAEQIDTLWSSGFEGASGGGGGGAASPVGHGCDIGYVGALWDPDLGLWQMRRRCYDPALGRWLTRDPAGYVDGMSLYGYVQSAPLMYYDPFGLQHAPGCEDLEKDTKRGIGNREPNTDLLTDEQKQSVKDGSDKQLTEWGQTGKQLVKDAGKVGVEVAMALNPFDEVMLGAIAAKFGVKAARAVIAKLARLGAKAVEEGAVGRLLTAEAKALQAEREMAKRAGGEWQAVNEAMSSRGAAYQEQITSRTGQSYIVNGVKFDGVGAQGLLDAKGPGYATFVRNGQFQPWFKGAEGLVDQAERQIGAANGTPITWHVAEPQAVTAIQNLLQSRGIQGITVVHTPPVP